MNKCRTCGAEIPREPGRPYCPEHHQEVERLMAEVSWENKHTPIVRVTSASQARRFNAMNRRRGPGQPIQLSPQGMPIRRDGDHGYTDKLGQKRPRRRR